MRCVKCNSEIPLGLDFCITCGHKVEEKNNGLENVLETKSKNEDVSLESSSYTDSKLNGLLKMQMEIADAINLGVSLKEEKVKIEEEKKIEDIKPVNELEKVKSPSLLPVFVLIGLLFVGLGVSLVVSNVNNKKEDEPVLEDSTADHDKVDEDTITTNNPNYGKASDVNNYLQRGDVGLASMYSSETNSYKTVDVEVTKFYRNSEVEPLINQYLSSNPQGSLNLEEGNEWVAVEYNVTLNNFTTSTSGVASNLDLQISGLNSEQVIFEGNAYNVNNYNIQYEIIQSGSSGRAINLYQLPKGCTDYLLQFGSYNQTIAYFKGE